MVDLKRFQPLDDGRDNPDQGGFRKGDFTGHAPWPNRPGMVDVIPRNATPPVAFRAGRNWAGVSYYVEKSRSGSIHHIVCFACDLVWTGKWVHRQIFKDIRQVEPEPRLSYVGPELEGPAMVMTPEGDRLCTCVAGMNQMQGGLLLIATNDEIRRALRRDAQLTSEGRHMEDPGAQLRAAIEITKAKPAMEAELDSFVPEED